MRRCGSGDGPVSWQSMSLTSGALSELPKRAEERMLVREAG